MITSTFLDPDRYDSAFVPHAPLRAEDSVPSRRLGLRGEVRRIPDPGGQSQRPGNLWSRNGRFSFVGTGPPEGPTGSQARRVRIGPSWTDYKRVNLPPPEEGGATDQDGRAGRKHPEEMLLIVSPNSIFTFRRWAAATTARCPWPNDTGRMCECR